MDELSARRQQATAAPSNGQRPPGGGGGEDRPPLWRWFSAQVAHKDKEKAAAARAIRERWDLPVKRFSAIDRSLAAEDSPHLIPFRQLLDEYRSLFGIKPDDDEFARQTGVGGLMVPFTVEKCEDCNRETVPGTGKCARHGGQWISAQDLADMSHRMHDRLITMSEAALRTLGDLMDNGRSEQVRALAAGMVLDRAGIGPHSTIQHTGEVTIGVADEAAAALRSRLEQLALNAANKVELTRVDTTEGGEVRDAEVVGE